MTSEELRLRNLARADASDRAIKSGTVPEVDLYLRPDTILGGTWAELEIRTPKTSRSYMLGPDDTEAIYQWLRVHLNYANDTE
jgi:hypothetical protein